MSKVNLVLGLNFLLPLRFFRFNENSSSFFVILVVSAQDYELTVLYEPYENLEDALL